MDAVAAGTNQQDQEIIVKNYAVLVKRIAYHLRGGLPQSVPVDDLIQAGMLGLLEAIRLYDESKGASFETYAGIRIRGHMLDEVRGNDWVPRSVYRNARRISEAVKQVQHRVGREAKDMEVAQELSLSLEEYHDMLQHSTSSILYGFGDLGVTEDSLYTEEKSTLNEPHAHVYHKDLLNHVNHVVEGLSPKEKMVWSLYYAQDLNLKEIGEVLEVTESRVSQILSQVKLRIQSQLVDN